MGSSVEIQTKRIAVASAALREVGNSDAVKYWSRVRREPPPYPHAWCGAFALWCLKEAGLASDIYWRDVLGFLMVRPHVLEIVHAPDTGDIAYFNHNQHHAVVCHATNGIVRLVNGNGEKGKVTISDTPLENVSYFFSIGRLLPITPDGEPL